MTPSTRRCVLLPARLPGIAMALILLFAVQAAARDERCDKPMDDFHQALWHGIQGLAELDAESHIPGLTDLIATLESRGPCGPCGVGWMPRNSRGDDPLYLVTVAGCEHGAPIYLLLQLHADDDACEIESVKHETDPEKALQLLPGENLAGVIEDGRRECTLNSEAPEPPEAPEKVVMVGGDVKAPVRIRESHPRYTREARKARIQGIVIIQATIDKQGNVVDTRILKGLPKGLSEMAEAAIKTWKFKPATLNGKPVAVYYNLTINFSLR